MHGKVIHAAPVLRPAPANANSSLERNILAALTLSAYLTFACTASAQTEAILHNFIPVTGEYPLSGVIADHSGNLYGTTSGGGKGAGVVYKLDSGGHYSVLYAFTGRPDGLYPVSPLTRDGVGNLYGTTEYGGAAGCGTVYKLDPNGRETVLYSFRCEPDGSNPYAGVTLGPAGEIYGTTLNGRASNGGTVFRLDPDGHETVLYSFTGGVDGYAPVAGVTLDIAGNLYGTTQLGGSLGNGVVYQLDRVTRREVVLHSFSGGPDGGFPAAGVVRDGNGNLYGTTFEGGANRFGVVYKLAPDGNETVLHTFSGGPADGEGPRFSLSADSSGNLYGVTLNGGTSDAGTIFKIDVTDHQESLVYSLDPADGVYPNGPLLIVNSNIYGTTLQGDPPVYGALFKITLTH